MEDLFKSVDKMIKEGTDWKKEIRRLVILSFKKTVIGDEKMIKEAEANLEEQIVERIEKVESGLVYDNEQNCIKILKKLFDNLIESYKDQMNKDGTGNILTSLNDDIDTISENFFSNESLGLVPMKMKDSIFKNFRIEKENYITNMIYKEQD